MDPFTQQPQQSQAPIDTIPANHKKVGPIIAILIIVLVLIIGALYLFASRINQQQAPAETTTVANTGASNSAAVESQTVQPITNKADDIDSIQADLDTSTNGLNNQNF